MSALLTMNCQKMRPSGSCPVETAFVTARDDEGFTYVLPVEAMSPVLAVDDVTQVVVRLPENVTGAPRDLHTKVTLRGVSTNEAVIKVGTP